MIKRFLPHLAACLALLTLAPREAAATGYVGKGYTLIVAPARYSVLQVAFDLVNRHSSVLVSYQGEATTPEPRLHAWNGQEWVRLTMTDYREVSFLQNPPARTVLIGDQQTLPAALVEASTWSPEVVHVTGLDTATLVNEFGRLLKFRESEWKWFASRYNLDLRDDNEALRARSWYDQPGPLRRSESAGLSQADESAAIEPAAALEPAQEVVIEPVEDAAAPAVNLPDADPSPIE